MLTNANWCKLREHPDREWRWPLWPLWGQGIHHSGPWQSFLIMTNSSCNLIPEPNLAKKKTAKKYPVSVSICLMFFHFILGQAAKGREQHRCKPSESQWWLEVHTAAGPNHQAASWHHGAQSDVWEAPGRPGLPAAESGVWHSEGGSAVGRGAMYSHQEPESSPGAAEQKADDPAGAVGEWSAAPYLQVQLWKVSMTHTTLQHCLGLRDPVSTYCSKQSVLFSGVLVNCKGLKVTKKIFVSYKKHLLL